MDIEVVDGGRVVVWLTERALGGAGADETALALQAAMGAIRSAAPLFRAARGAAGGKTLSREQMKRLTAALARTSAAKAKLRKNVDDMRANLDRLDVEELTCIVNGGGGA